MKKSTFIVFAILFVFGLGLYFLSPFSRSEEQKTEVTEVIEEKEAAPEEVPESAAEKPPETEIREGAIAPVSAANVQKAFAQSLRSLGQCLETQNSVPGDELEPTLRTLVDSVRGEWGESVISTEDWLQIDVETPEGEKRRIRVEMDFDNETQIQRKLKYTTLENNGESRPIPVPEDQAVEPSDSLIASLEAGNKVLAREKFERVYFQNGEEIVARQLDGFISELEVNRGNKSFKCKGLNAGDSSCQCL